MKKKAVITIFLIAVSANVMAVFGTGGGAAPFLRTGAGARALALSGAFTAYYDDAVCSYWNPAAAAQLKQAAISSTFSWLSQERSYNFFNAICPSDYGTFGLNLINFSAGGIEGRTGDTQDFYTFTDSENAYFITYARKFIRDISLGVNLKYIRQTLSSYGAEGLSADLGLHVKFNDFASFGLVFQDVAGNLSWSTGTTEKIPFVMRIGSLLRFMDGDIKWSVDAEENEFEGVTFKTGAEAVIIKIISLRAGMSYGASNYKFDYTLGAGLKYAFGNFIFQLDYCFMREEFYNSFDADHKMSINVYFNI
jgi:hypothetical protein